VRDHIHPGKSLLPVMQRLDGHSELSGKLFGRRSGLKLFDRSDNLVVGKSFLYGVAPSPAFDRGFGTP
jgi:hypothetical protein